jgi:hypothetical protein
MVRPTEAFVLGRRNTTSTRPKTSPAGEPRNCFGISGPLRLCISPRALLGDGHIAAHHRGVYELRISMDSRYPGLIGETVRATHAVFPRNRVYVTKHPVHNVVVIGCASKALPMLFPQHGPGRKHTRRIELAQWQKPITFVHAEELIRGLIHSDGSRFVARQRRSGRVYCYSRYCFKNRSADIMRIFGEHLDLLEIRWTLTDPEQAQIARRESVQMLDGFVGPKT